MAEGDRRRRGVDALGGVEGLGARRRFRIRPELVVQALHQLPSRGQLPGDLREDLVLLVDSWIAGIAAGLTVVVAQVLVSGEEPQPIPDDRSAQRRRDVLVPLALIAALRLVAAVTGALDRLAGQRIDLRAVHGVAPDSGCLPAA